MPCQFLGKTTNPSENMPIPTKTKEFQNKNDNIVSTFDSMVKKFDGTLNKFDSMFKRFDIIFSKLDGKFTPSVAGFYQITYQITVTYYSGSNYRISGLKNNSDHVLDYQFGGYSGQMINQSIVLYFNGSNDYFNIISLKSRIFTRILFYN